MRIGLLLLAIATVVAMGCQAPCDRMCDAEAEYIGACIADAKAAIDEGRTPQAGWDVYENPDDWWSGAYGVGGAEEYATSCKEDADAVLAAAEDGGLTEQECEDEALVKENAILDEESPACHLIP